MALNEEQIEQVRGLIHSGGWANVVKPILGERGRQVNRLFRLLPSERPEPYRGMEDKDVINILRGRLEEIEWILAAFDNEVTVYDLNRRKDELQRQHNGITANP
jgi:hypothetical protein